MLRTENIHNPNIHVAAEDAIYNIELLALGGYTLEAHTLSKSLLSPGSWKVNEFTNQFGSQPYIIYTIINHKFRRK